MLHLVLTASRKFLGHFDDYGFLKLALFAKLLLNIFKTIHFRTNLHVTQAALDE